MLSSSGTSGNPLQAIGILRKLCNHPDLLRSVGRSKDVGGDECNSAQEQAAQSNSSELHARIESCFASAGRSAEEDVSVFSGKLACLKMVLESIYTSAENGSRDRIVVVSNYTQTLDIIQSVCSSQGWKFLRLDGTTDVSGRQSMVNRFNSGFTEEFIFLLSSKAGGTGLNLIGANRLILFDPDWNPATDAQWVWVLKKDPTVKLDIYPPYDSRWRQMGAKRMEDKETGYITKPMLDEAIMAYEQQRMELMDQLHKVGKNAEMAFLENAEARVQQQEQWKPIGSNMEEGSEGQGENMECGGEEGEGTGRSGQPLKRKESSGEEEETDSQGGGAQKTKRQHKSTTVEGSTTAKSGEEATHDTAGSGEKGKEGEGKEGSQDDSTPLLADKEKKEREERRKGMKNIENMTEEEILQVEEDQRDGSQDLDPEDSTKEESDQEMPEEGDLTLEQWIQEVEQLEWGRTIEAEISNEGRRGSKKRKAQGAEEQGSTAGNVEGSQDRLMEEAEQQRREDEEEAKQDLRKQAAILMAQVNTLKDENRELEEDRAMARVWRDGQQKDVVIYRFLSTGSIEEKIYQRQIVKGEVAAAVAAKDGDRGSKKGQHFTREELKELFQLQTETACDTYDLLYRSRMPHAMHWKDVSSDVIDPPLKWAVSGGTVTFVHEQTEETKAGSGYDGSFCESDLGGFEPTRSGSAGWSADKEEDDRPGEVEGPVSSSTDVISEALRDIGNLQPQHNVVAKVEESPRKRLKRASDKYSYPERTEMRTTTSDPSDGAVAHLAESVDSDILATSADCRENDSVNADNDFQEDALIYYRTKRKSSAVTAVSANNTKQGDEQPDGNGGDLGLSGGMKADPSDGGTSYMSRDLKSRDTLAADWGTAFEDDMMLAELDISCGCSVEMEIALASNGFDPQDLWFAKKSFLLGFLLGVQEEKDAFSRSKLGRIIVKEFKGVPLDRAAELAFPMVAEYIGRHYGHESTALADLISRYEDRRALSATENGRFLLRQVDAEAKRAADKEESDEHQPLDVFGFTSKEGEAHPICNKQSVKTSAFEAAFAFAKDLGRGSW
ncbi:hypothetical protein CBR_g40169 [Chara braunii]|uniref:Helicase C-terminal domain-containing protein n=1 Tax=Chara braunii TaxID=69332 RepID=A0A388LTD4_CHABU|nr:hypothetical protein CBR_g40169 [Chara braunii]|eukprot:GBG85531.1 hypothetical protein CBR_g40169 [Chara braunii]